MHLKKLFKTVLSRTVIVSVLILLQLLFLMWIFRFLNEYSGNILFGTQISAVLLVVYIVSRDTNPSYKIVWIVIVLSLAPMGMLFYVLWGTKNISKVEIRKNKVMSECLSEMLPQNDSSSEKLKKECEHSAIQSDFIRRTAIAPVFENTSAEYFPLGEAKFKKLLEELKLAKEFIFMEYFIIESGQMWDPILEILTQKVQEGVEVRLMYDDVGCLQTLPYRYHHKLIELGIKVVVFNPFRPSLNMAMNYRDHRKICVIDGNTGFCGGINLADEYINAYEKHGHWKDTAVLLRGEGVWGLTSLFLSIWQMESGEKDEDTQKYRPTKTEEISGFVQPYGDSPFDDHNVAEYSYMQYLNRATDYVYITSPYLIIDNEMATALKIAAQSGVDVRIITPGMGDKWYVHMLTQAFYLPLVESGVRIYEYSKGFIHAKMVVSDDEVATVGTVNMDYRSFYLHFECGVNFYKAPVIKDIKSDIDALFNICKEYTIEDCKNVPMYKRITRSVIRMFAPMM